MDLLVFMGKNSLLSNRLFETFKKIEDVNVKKKRLFCKIVYSLDYLNIKYFIQIKENSILIMSIFHS